MEHMEKISSMIDDDITELEACCFRGAPFLGNRDEELIGFLDKIFACEVKVDICGDSVPRELYGALPGHRFIQTVYNIHNFCELPENVTSVCGNEDEVIENAILCDNEAEVHMAAEYGILNEGTADRAVKCAVENKRFKSLKAINDIFGREVCEKE